MYRLITALIVAMGLGGYVRAEPAVDLLQAYELARASEPRLRSAEQTLEVAREQENQALAVLLPKASAFASVSANEMNQETAVRNPVTGYMGHRYGASLQQILFNLPAFLEKERFASQAEQRQEEYNSAQMDLIKDVTVRYFDVLAARDVLEVLDAEKEATAKDMHRTQEMFKRQMAKITDVYQIEAHYDALLSEEIVARNKVAVALESLRELTGTPVAAVKPLPTEIRFPALKRSLDEWVGLSKQNSPVLQALIHGIEAAETYIDQQWAGHLPTLNLTLSYVTSNTTYDSRQFPPYDTKSASVDINVPLFQGGGVEARKREAIARLGIVKETREQKEREIEKQTRTAFLSAQASLAQIESTAKAVRAAEKARDAMEKSYAFGISTIVDVLKSQKVLSEARIEQVTAKYEYIKSYIQLKHGAGIVAQEDLAEVNGWITSR